MTFSSRLAVLTLVTAFVLPGTALAQDAYARSSTWLRAGPSAAYPRVAAVARDEALDIHGCLRGRSWCDVSADGDRGWIRGASIDYVYGGRRVIITNPRAAGIAILSFGVTDYWDRHYRDRSWYRDRHPDRRPNRPSRPNRDDARDGRPGPDRPALLPLRPERPAVRPPQPERRVLRPLPQRPTIQQPPRPQRGPEPGAGLRRCPPGGECR